MAQDPQEIFVAPSGKVYVAPVGTAEPATAVASLNAAFQELGLITEDGAALSTGGTVERIRSWQRYQPVRTVIQSQDTQVRFALQQWNEDTLVVAFGGGTITPVGSNLYKYTAPDPAGGVAEYCMVMDVQDGAKITRFVFPRVTLAETVETTFSRAAAAILPIAFDVLGPETGSAWYALFSGQTAFGT